MTLLSIGLVGCSGTTVRFEQEGLELVNREITLLSSDKNTVSLNRQKGDGMALIKDLEFTEGLIEVELMGEDNPGRSFVGIAFNIENDSTYEAVYFRPFNFRAEEQLRREHAVQYIYHPKHTWRFLRSNFTGQYEAPYPRQPLPDAWFAVQIKVTATHVYVYDQETQTELLSVERLSAPVSNRLGLWTGFNSKGSFRNLKVSE